MVDVKKYIEDPDINWRNYSGNTIDSEYFKEFTFERYMDFEFGFSFRFVPSMEFFYNKVIFSFSRRYLKSIYTVKEYTSTYIRDLVYDFFKYQNDDSVLSISFCRDNEKFLIFDSYILNLLMVYLKKLGKEYMLYEEAVILISALYEDKVKELCCVKNKGYIDELRTNKTKFRKPIVYMHEGRYSRFELRSAHNIYEFCSLTQHLCPAIGIKYNEYIFFLRSICKYFSKRYNISFWSAYRFDDYRNRDYYIAFMDFLKNFLDYSYLIKKYENSNEFSLKSGVIL